MEGINEALLVGNLGQDPELRATGSGTSVLTIRLATTTRYLQGDTWKDRTEWHTVVVWGKRADGLAKVLSKGSRVLVKGEIQTRTWEDKAGAKRYSTEINARSVLLMDSKPGSGDHKEDLHKSKQPDYGPDPNGTDSLNDDDIPF